MALTPRAPLTRRELEAQIIAKAWRDPAYMEALKRDPKAVLQAETHAVDPTIALPADLKVHVHEETPHDFHLVLPRNPADIKLSEVVGDSLETVAPQTVAVVVAVVTIGVVAANIAAAANGIGAVNAVGAANGVTTGNAVGNFNAIVNSNVIS